MSKEINPILIPNVSKVGTPKPGEGNKLKDGQKSEFGNLLKDQISKVHSDHGINLSVHAAKRIKERDLGMDNLEFFKIKDAMDKIRDKGGKDSLVITKTGAYIVDVDNNMIVTALGKDNITQNVFTKIDSTVIMD